MSRILLIAMPNLSILQLKDDLIQKGFNLFQTSEESETIESINACYYDCYILEPFSSFKMAARVIRLLNELNYFSKILLLLPGARPHEEFTARKIVQENYFSINESFETITKKINSICSLSPKNNQTQIKLSSPITHYMKSEIEKAKRGNTSLSFLYFRSHNINSDKYIIKINDILHDRLRISDEAFPYKNGILVLLFGTSKDDRAKIKSIIFEKINSTLKEENIDFFTDFETNEATYPHDGKTYIEIIQALESPISKAQKNDTSPQTLSDFLKLTESFDKSFRRGRNENKINAIAINSYITTNILPPTWLGAFYQIENDPSQFYHCFIENDPLITVRILTISNGLMQCFSQFTKNLNQQALKTFQEIISIFGLEEFKNICIFCILEKTFLDELAQSPELHQRGLFQIAVGLELSKYLDYPQKSELLLCLFCQNLSYILINKKSPQVYQTILNKNKTTNNCIGKLLFEEINFTPSELSIALLKRWNIEEHITESAYCARYEFIPKLNPQLTAMTHLAIVTANYIKSNNSEKNLKLSKIALDEIRLRNRNFQFDSINYLNDTQNQWGNLYSFIKPYST
jgi:HD-like signal output (HDOD) protein